jgi:UDP-N-acetyl-D-mannosaminuronic acid transferase (WecB/TagA/CpsF family)
MDLCQNITIEKLFFREKNNQMNLLRTIYKVVKMNTDILLLCSKKCAETSPCFVAWYKVAKLWSCRKQPQIGQLISKTQVITATGL